MITAHSPRTNNHHFRASRFTSNPQHTNKLHYRDRLVTVDSSRRTVHGEPSRKQNHDSLFNSCSTAFITVIFPSKISLFKVSTCVCFPSCSKNWSISADSNDSSNQCCNWFLRLSDQKPLSVIFSWKD